CLPPRRRIGRQKVALLRDPATWCDGLRATRCFHSPWSHLDVRQSPTSASSGSAAQQEATADRFCTRGLRAVSRGRKQWHGHKLLERRADFLDRRRT
ncbi:unnamed protein product, partial [Prorocentrum cordatum]